MESVSSKSSPSRSSAHVAPAFPTPGTVAPATVTVASAHSASPLHFSASAVNALSAPAEHSSSSKATPPAIPRPAGSSSSSSASVLLPSTTSVATQTAPSISAANSNTKVLPYLFDDAQLDDVLVLVVDMLVRLTEHNDSLPLDPSALTRFHSRATPNISLSAYLRRIAKYTSIEKCCVLILLVYIDRVCERLEGFTICGLTVHRFICAAILCASKALCDAFNTNEHYAKVGGISLQEINLLEKEFLQIIDWRLICGGAELQHYYASLVRNHKDYVLDEPKRTGQNLQEQKQEHGLAAMELDGAEASAGSDMNGHDGTSGNTATDGSIRAGATAQAASSQHSSPFPLPIGSSNSNSNTSTSASPFTTSTATNGSGRSLTGVATSSASGSSSGDSQRGAAAGSSSSIVTSPTSAMQVDAEPWVTSQVAAPAMMNRRRKDEHRTPPSPLGQSQVHAPQNGGSSVNAVQTNGHASSTQQAQHSTVSANADAYKRTRFDHPPRQ